VPSGFRVDFVLTDNFAEMEDRIEEALAAGVQNAAEEFKQRAEDRVVAQDIPGPPLSEQTVKIKRRNGARLPEFKWLYQDRAVDGTFIIVTPQKNSAKAEIISPDDRPAYIYDLLEFGGINEHGLFVPARPLWTTVARADANQVLLAFYEGFQSVLR